MAGPLKTQSLYVGKTFDELDPEIHQRCKGWVKELLARERNKRKYM